MAYDEQLAERIRGLIAGRRDFVEKQMFGGVAFLLHGNMCIGLWKESLIARIGPGEYEAALEDPAVQEFDITGRPMNGWVMVDPEGTDSVADLEKWFGRCESFVKTLPKKKAQPAKKRPADKRPAAKSPGKTQRVGKKPKRHEGSGGKS